MKSPFRIKEVDGIDEWDALEYMQKTCFPEDCFYPPDTGHWWITYDGKDHIAFCGLKPLQYETGYLCRAGVMPAYRGHGLQARLIRVRERKAKVIGLKAIITDTNLNPASANSLIRCGFKTYNPDAPWSFATAIYWKKDIG